ncbi:MAG: proline--tRNA ligase [Patescibacteria group bacterium]|jgi:prolyl-tRNA synthetase|nr:proline--tRNA ligase [Patescibacteria group bacterium]
MRQSKLFGRTNKAVKDYASKNAELLIKGGFIQQTMAGVYSFLPLGKRVLDKIENIIREEMDKIGQELLLPSIVPNDLWETTGRLEKVSVLFKAVPGNAASKKVNDAEYVLNSTHEEVITPIAKSFNFSYKDLPFAVYQVQTKFRNEARPKSGLLRGREFRMKDLYSFHRNEAELKEYYEQAKAAYFKVFERLGIGQDTYLAAASGGDFTKDFSHEFQTRCATGEDTIFYDQSIKVAYNREVAPAQAPALKQDQDFKECQDVEGQGIIGVAELSGFLNIPAEKTTKTLIYETDRGEVIAAAVRGVYDINEEKLARIIGVESLELASEETVKKVTGAKVGYAGLLNLDKQVRQFVDESLRDQVNFEMGANRTNYHTVNVNWGRDLPKPEKFYDFKIAREGDLNPETGQVYEVFKASEVGNIFPLNTKFSRAFNYYYTDEAGQQQIVYMGSYGIGSSRVMGVLVEKFFDNKGIIWPESVAPYQIHLLQLGFDQSVVKAAEKAYDKLLANGVEVLFDDRIEASAGEKFADADLIGIPYRLVISAKTKNKIEVKKRNEAKTQLLSLGQVLKLLTK